MKLLLLSAAMTWVACGEMNTGGTDSGTTSDSGTTVTDSGTTVVDSGTTVVDAGNTTVDAGRVDSGTVLVDAGTADSGTTVTDAGVVFNDCTEAKFVDKKAENNTTVNFGGSLGQTYSPACVLIAVGHSVTFKGNFQNHPISPGIPGSTTAGSPNNPIVARNSGSTDLTANFATAGDYPYICVDHNNNGMSGVVRVR